MSDIDNCNLTFFTDNYLHYCNVSHRLDHVLWFLLTSNTRIDVSQKISAIIDFISPGELISQINLPNSVDVMLWNMISVCFENSTDYKSAWLAMYDLFIKISNSISLDNKEIWILGLWCAGNACNAHDINELVESIPMVKYKAYFIGVNMNYAMITECNLDDFILSPLDIPVNNLKTIIRFLTIIHQINF